MGRCNEYPKRKSPMANWLCTYFFLHMYAYCIYCTVGIAVRCVEDTTCNKENTMPVTDYILPPKSESINSVYSHLIYYNLLLIA